MEYIKFKKELQLSDIIAIVNEIMGENKPLSIKVKKTSTTIIGISDGRYAAQQTLCFLEQATQQKNLQQLTNSIIISNSDTAQTLEHHSIIIVDDPRALFIDLLNQLKKSPGFHYFTSLLDGTADIHAEADIHPQATIEDNVFIGKNSKIAAGCVIKQGTRIGANVIIRENTVIGCDGITLYKANDDRILRFPHIAGVSIADEVEIGASCVLPRGVIHSSFIGHKSVIGNLSNIGHSVHLGNDVWLAVGCLIGGNTHIGDKSTLGLGVNIRDNLRIGNNCSIGMGSVVVSNAADGISLFGNPAKKMRTIKAGPSR